MNKKLSLVCVLLSICVLLTACSSGNATPLQPTTNIITTTGGTTIQSATNNTTVPFPGTPTTVAPSSPTSTQQNTAITTKPSTTTTITTPNTDYNSLNFVNGFRRGVNMGNMLEAPNEGDWGQYIEDEYFKIIKQRGFDFVRVPIKWSNHQKDWIIDKEFFERVDHVIEQILKNDLGAVINIHHFDELNSEPDTAKQGLYKMWTQIAQRYKNLPKSIAFEVNNEPNDKMTATLWNQVQQECIKVIRKSNPTRKIVVTGANWGGAGGINETVLPNDKNLIMSFHYYSPMAFTHQGADWGSSPNTQLGVQWNGTEYEKAQIDSTFRQVRAWSQATGIPVLLGEFGAYDRGPYDSRVRWTQCVRETAEKYGFSWSYWEFCAGFGVYDKTAKQYHAELANALIPSKVNTNVGQRVESPVAIVTKTGNTIGPVTLKTAIDYTSYEWCGYACIDTNNSLVIHLYNVSDWNRVCFGLDVTDTGSGFSKNQVEFTFKNIDKSITDICFNLETKDGKAEKEVHWISDELFGNTNGVKQNADGTTTVTIDISKGYSALKGKMSSGVNLKAFIESVPNHSDYDAKGSLEIISVKCK